MTIEVLRDFLMRSSYASTDPAVADAGGQNFKLKQARLRTLQRTLKRPWKRVAGQRLWTALSRAVARL